MATYLKPIKEKYPLCSWADTIQMASALAIEHAGGPKIDMKYGRVDIEAKDCAPPKSREGFGDNTGLPLRWGRAAVRHPKMTNRLIHSSLFDEF